MAGPISRAVGYGVANTRAALRAIKKHGPSQLQFWFIALAIGIASGFAALFFRLSIGWIEGVFYGTDESASFTSIVSRLAWYQILVIPILGGLTVGLILDRFTDEGRAHTVSDVIEGAALNEGRVAVRRVLRECRRSQRA